MNRIQRSRAWDDCSGRIRDLGPRTSSRGPYVFESAGGRYEPAGDHSG